MGRVMIVDDNFVMRRNIRLIVEKLGHDVVGEADDGEDVVMVYGRVNPDIITMDITMPNMNGIDAMKKIKEKYPEAKIVMISAMGQKNKVLQSINAGAEHFIVKQINEKKVSEVFKKVLNKQLPIDSKIENYTINEIGEIQLNDDAGADVVEAFLVESKKIDDAVEIKIKKCVSEEIAEIINKEVQKYLFKKPLNIKFLFGENEFESELVKEEFEKILKKIKNAGGIYSLDKSSAPEC